MDAERMPDAIRTEKINALGEALENLWSGGGEYGVYTVAVQREKMRKLLHELLNPSPATSE